MKYRNLPMVPRVIFGRGSIEELHQVLMPKRQSDRAPMIFLIDDVFENRPDLYNRIPLMFNDQIIWVCADEEPKTSQVDALADQIRQQFEELPSGIIGIGGGTVMDLAKAVAIMLNNEGKAHEYQGWDLVKQNSLYHLGIPTISGTGAEVSRTTVLTGPVRKLGINSDFTPFNQVILDPALTEGVPKNQWFYTGMDCYIHCVESLTGHYINAFSKSYGEKAFELCKEVFLNPSLQKDEAQDMLMMASWHGGMSIAYSQVGVAHALSYGLSYVLGTRHGIGNCLVFDKLEDYYPDGVKLFREMMEVHEITLPGGVCSQLSEQQFDTMINVALSLEPLWENAIGKQWRDKINKNVLRELYEKI